MSSASTTQSRGQRVTIIVLAIAVAISIIALVISLVQVTKEKQAIQSAADNAQVVTKEIAADSAVLNSSIAKNTADVATISQQADAVAQGATTNATDAAAQAKANGALSDGSTKVAGEVTALSTAVTGIGTSIAAQQNASSALVSLITDMQNDPQVGLTVLGTNATNLSTKLNTACSGGGSCTISATDLQVLITLAADVSTGLNAQNTALADPSATVSALSASKALNKGLTDIQAQGNQATNAGKTLLADMKLLGTGITDASTSAKKLSDNAAKLSTSATALSKTATGVKQSSSVLASQGDSFNKTIQDMSSGSYQPDLAELSVPTVVLVGIALVFALLVFLVIWMAVRNRKQA